MKHKVVGLAAVLLFFSTLAFAKPKEKIFANTPQEVFQAALRTARERHVITFVDEKQLMFTFDTGASVFSNGFLANASVEAQPDGKAKLIINVQHRQTDQGGGPSFGAGDRMADKFFEQVLQELAADSKQAASVQSAAAHVDVPAGAAAPPPEVSTATVQVNSTPDGADITVDGNFSGNTPAMIKLAPGKHTVAISQTGFTAWNRDLSVTAGSELHLNAVLEKQAP